MHRAAIFLLLSAIAFGCVRSQPPYKPDLSWTVYEKEMVRLDESGVPRVSYEDWRLIASREDLRNLYAELLHIDLEMSSKLVMKNVEERQEKLEQYAAKRGYTNSSDFVDFCDNHQDQWNKIVEDFNQDHPNRLAQEIGPIVVFWDSWTNYRDAEMLFRRKMKQIAVRPQDAAHVLILSAKHRHAFGQWETATGGMSYPLYFASDEMPHPDPAVQKALAEGNSPYEIDEMRFEDSYVEYSRRLAANILNSFQPAQESTLLCFELIEIAREEIALSSKTQKEEQWASSFQWASDAVVTARSAKALYELETTSTK